MAILILVMLRGFEKLLVLYLRRLPSRPDGVPNAGEADVFFQGEYQLSHFSTPLRTEYNISILAEDCGKAGLEWAHNCCNYFRMLRVSGLIIRG